MPSNVHTGKSIANAVMDVMQLMYTASDARWLKWFQTGFKGGREVEHVSRLVRLACRETPPTQHLLRRLVWHWSVNEGLAVVCCVRRGAAVSFTTALVVEATQVELARVVDGHLTDEEFDRLTVAMEQLANSQIVVAEVAGVGEFRDAMHNARLQSQRPLVVAGFALSQGEQSAARKSGLRVLSPSSRKRRSR
jgi:replicative DNA helicase